MKRLLTALLAIESVLLVLALIIIAIQGSAGSPPQTKLTRETDATGRYAVTIWRIGEPEWSFGSDHLKVQLSDTENFGNNVSFESDVKSDGAYASYKIEWIENAVKITLNGSDQPPAEYILPFPE